jgi:hypothetical protein
MRGHAYEFAKATEACHAEIVEGAFTHDGHSAVARHVGNARRRPYRDAVAIGKESPDSPRKIDAAVCVIGARMVRRMVLGSGKKFGKASRQGRGADMRRLVSAVGVLPALHPARSCQMTRRRCGAAARPKLGDISGERSSGQLLRREAAGP